jgi:hypothetical protein
LDHSFPVTEREGLFTIGIGFSLGGLLFVVIGIALAAGLLGEGGSHVPAGVLCALVGSAAAFLGWDYLYRQTWMITTRADGMVVIQRALRSTLLPATSINVLHRQVRRLGVEGGDSRILKLFHFDGTVPITFFPEIELFICEVHALNPEVEIRGEWNM